MPRIAYRVDRIVDLGDQADAGAYGKALDLVLADPGVDGVLVIKTPSALGETTAIADALIQRLAGSRHSIIANSSFSWWAAWLGDGQEHADRMVVAPQRWFAGADSAVEDRCPPGWTVL